MNDTNFRYMGSSAQITLRSSPNFFAMLTNVRITTAKDAVHRCFRDNTDVVEKNPFAFLSDPSHWRPSTSSKKDVENCQKIRESQTSSTFEMTRRNLLFPLWAVFT